VPGSARGDARRQSDAQRAGGETGRPVGDVLGDLVRGLADAVIVADVDGEIVFWNEAATRLFGWTSREAIGETLDLIIPERLRARHWAGYALDCVHGDVAAPPW
jgi:PAS domain-containing protein